VLGVFGVDWLLESCASWLSPQNTNIGTNKKK
jgi:hypothetical protein